MEWFRTFARTCILLAGIAASSSGLAQSSATLPLVGQWNIQTATGATTTNGVSVDLITKGLLGIRRSPSGLTATISWLDERGQITGTRTVEGTYSNGSAIFTHTGTRSRSGRDGRDISTEVKISWTLHAKGDVLSGERLVETYEDEPKPVTGTRVSALSAPALAASMAAPHPAQESPPERGPSTPAERARVVQMAVDAEKDPRPVQARDGTWLENWVNEIPDLTFNQSAPASWLNAVVKGDLRETFQFQYKASVMAFQIKHPKQAALQSANDLAGMEGVLHAYEALVRENARYRCARLDLALKARNQGQLPAFLLAVAGRDPD